MKKLLLSLILVLSALTFYGQAGIKIQTDGSGQLPVTNQLPVGTTFKSGKISISKGFVGSYADNKQVIVVKRINGNITGTFTCYCTGQNGEGECLPTLAGNAIICTPIGKCQTCQPLINSTEPPKGTAITKSGINWKKFSPLTKENKN